MYVCRLESSFLFYIVSKIYLFFNANFKFENWFQDHKILLIQNDKRVHRGLQRTVLMPYKAGFMIRFNSKGGEKTE